MDISIKNIQKDDEVVFQEFFNEFYQALCAFANSYVSDNALSADIVQETFVKIWNKRQDFDSLLKMKSFLYTAVRNTCLNKIRDQKNKRIDLAEVSNYSFFQDTLLENETYRILYHAIEELPSQSRRIIELALDGKKNEEIAASLGITKNSVLTLKKLAYRKLRSTLEKYYYLLFLFLLKDTDF